jgi:hypothetical protein
MYHLVLNIMDDEGWLMSVFQARETLAGELFPIPKGSHLGLSDGGP